MARGVYLNAAVLHDAAYNLVALVAIGVVTRATALRGLHRRLSRALPPAAADGDSAPPARTCDSGRRGWGA